MKNDPDKKKPDLSISDQDKFALVDSINVVSMTDCTGLLATIPQNQDEAEAMQEIINPLAKDTVAFKKRFKTKKAE